MFQALKFSEVLTLSDVFVCYGRIGRFIGNMFQRSGLIAAAEK